VIVEAGQPLLNQLMCPVKVTTLRSVVGLPEGVPASLRWASERVLADPQQQLLPLGQFAQRDQRARLSDRGSQVHGFCSQGSLINQRCSAVPPTLHELVTHLDELVNRQG
jgi:hypothetical protein